jgi:hypothetical protein
MDPAMAEIHDPGPILRAVLFHGSDFSGEACFAPESGRAQIERAAACRPLSRLRAVTSASRRLTAGDPGMSCFALRHVPMSSIAQWLVARMPAVAEGHAVAGLERLPVRTLNRDAAHHPDWPVDRTIGCDFRGHGNLLRQVRLDIRCDRSATRMGSARPSP